MRGVRIGREDALRRHGVNPYLSREPAAPTGTSINPIYHAGHRHFVSCLASNESLALEDLDLSGLPRYEHLSRTDVWFSEPMLYGGNQRLFRAARDAGMSISIDLNWDPHTASRIGERAPSWCTWARPARATTAAAAGSRSSSSRLSRPQGW